VSYGVNRARKRPTRRKKRQSSSGRARAAAKGRSRATSTRRGTSARRAPKRSARKAARRKSPSTRKRTTSKSKRKARLYTRYDPETGQKVRVPSDSYEYGAWLSRKPSKKKQTRQALVNDPVGTLGMLGATAGKKAVERAGERAGRSVLSSARAAGLGAIGLTAAGVGAAATSAAILAAGYHVMSKVAAANTVKLGDRINAISNRYIETVRQLKAAGASDQALKNALRDYKQALSTAAAQAQGYANVTPKVEGSYK